MKYYNLNFSHTKSKWRNIGHGSAILAIVFVLLLGILLPSVERPKKAHAYNGFLRRQNMNIVDGSGNRVIFRGTNLGNWLLWEPAPMGAVNQTTIGQTKVLQNLASITGADRAKQFESDVYANYFTQADFQEIANRGFNVVRLGFNYRILEDDAAPGTYKDSGWQILDNAVNWAQQAGIYINLDMHAAPGAQSSYYIADPSTSSAQLYTAANQTRTINMWKAIASRYKDNPAIAGWDLLNEPIPPNNNALTSFYQQLVPAVRAADPNHLIMLEGTNFAKDNSIFANRYDENMALAIHQYMWGTWWPEYDITSAIDQAKRLNVPIWVNEYGEDTNQTIQNRTNRYANDPALSGYAAWTWKTTTFQYSGRTTQMHPYHFAMTPAWQKTVNWLWDTSKPKPTLAETEQGLQDYIAQMKVPTLNAATLAALYPASVGTGTGLTGTYYGDNKFTSQKLTRIDPVLNFNWGWGSPAASMPSDYFTVRWTGSIEPQYSENYTFTSTSDDGMRVWVGNTLVIDDWVNSGTHSKSGTIALQAGQKYPIKIEYFEATWGAQTMLQWQSPSTPQAVIPTSQLYSN